MELGLWFLNLYISMWLGASGYSAIKFNSDGTLARYKASWVFQRFTQHGIGYGETFNQVIVQQRPLLLAADAHAEVQQEKERARIC